MDQRAEQMYSRYSRPWTATGLVFVVVLRPRVGLCEGFLKTTRTKAQLYNIGYKQDV